MKIGKQRAYNLGRFLRQRYEKFLQNGTYSSNQITVRSSDWDRSINTANLVLAGLFPPKGNQVWNYNLPWQPIAVHSIPKPIDYILYAEVACKRLIEAREEYSKSPETQKIMDDNRELLQYVENHAGEPVRTIDSLNVIREALEIENHLNKT